MSFLFLLTTLDKPKRESLEVKREHKCNRYLMISDKDGLLIVAAEARCRERPHFTLHSLLRIA